MAITTSTIKTFWDSNRPPAVCLVSTGALLALWSGATGRGPGVAIGLLAAIAGIMSIRPDMHIFEKVAWVVILVVLACLEIHAIQKSDDQNFEAKKKQNEQFEEIASKLKDELAITASGFDATGRGISGSVQALKENSQQSKRQFDASMSKANGILEGTNRVALTTRQSLDTLAGTGSVPCVTMKRQEIYKTDVLLVLSNLGENNLTGITVQVNAHKNSRELMQVFTKEVAVLSPGTYLEIGNVDPVPGKDGQADLWITISAQNGVYEEMFLLRRPFGRWNSQQTQYSIRKISPGVPQDLGVCKHTFGERFVVR